MVNRMVTIGTVEWNIGVLKEINGSDRRGRPPHPSRPDQRLAPARRTWMPEQAGFVTQAGSCRSRRWQQRCRSDRQTVIDWHEREHQAGPWRGGGKLPTGYQAAFAVSFGSKADRLFSMVQATPRSRSATERSALARPFPRDRRAVYLALQIGSC